MAYLEFSGTLERYNITYQRIVGGSMKDIGSPYKPLTQEERDFFQIGIDELHAYFMADVAKNRNIDKEKMKEIATGTFYTGQQALELNLIDSLGGKQEALDIIEKNIGVKVNLVSYSKKSGFLSSLVGVISDSFFRIGQGIGSVVFKDNNLVIRT